MAGGPSERERAEHGAAVGGLTEGRPLDRVAGESAPSRNRRATHFKAPYRGTVLRMRALTFDAVYEDAGDGWVYAHVPEFPEVHPKGRVSGMRVRWSSTPSRLCSRSVANVARRFPIRMGAR